MSKQVKTLSEVKSRSILEQTLKEIGVNPTQISETKFSWGTGFNKMSVDLDTGEISYDDMKTRQLNEFKHVYSKNFVVANILKKGHKVKSKRTLSDGRVEIIASY